MKTEELLKTWAEVLDLAETRPEAIDERLPDLLRYRYEAEPVRLSDSAREDGLSSLLSAASEMQASSNGESTYGLLAAIRSPRARYPLAIAGALVVVLLIAVFLLWSRKDQPYVKTIPPRHQKALQPSPSPRKAAVVKANPPAVKSGSPVRPRYVRGAPKRSKKLHRDLVASTVVIGTVGAVVGSPSMITQSQHHRLPLKPGMSLYGSTTVETGDMDRVDLAFRDGTVLKLGYDTRIRIPSVLKTELRPKRIYQDTGKLYAEVRHLDAKTTFSVATPAATAEALGTAFSLAVRGQTGLKPSETVLNVVQGRVRFFNAYGSVLSQNRTESHAAIGSAPSEPHRRRFSWLGGIKLVTQHLWENTAAERVIYPVGTVGAGASDFPKRGVFFTGVEPDSPAARAGIEKDDQLIVFNDHPVHFAWEFNVVIRGSGPGAKYDLVVRRGGRQISISVTTESLHRAPLPRLDPKFGKELYGATWPMLSYIHYADDSLRRLKELGKRYHGPALYNNIGVANQIKEQLGEAIRNYERAVELDPSVAIYHWNLGYALFLIGNSERSIEELKMAVHLDPSWLPSTDDLWRAQSTTGRLADALATVEAAKARFGINSEIVTREVQTLVQMHRPFDALRAAQTGLDPWVGDPSKLQSVTDVGDYQLQLESTRKVYEASRGTNLWMTLDIAEVLADFGQDSEAEALFRQCIRNRPEEYQCYNQYGGYLRAHGRLAEAESMERLAVGHSPYTAEANLGLAEVLVDLGRNQEAEKFISKALNIDSDEPHVLWEVGTIRQRQERAAEAEELYRTAISLTDPQDTGLARMYGDLGSLIHRPVHGAEEALRKAAKLSSQDPMFQSEFAWFLAENDRSPSEAVSLARKAANLVPSSARFADNLGWTLVKSGDLDAAIAELLKAIELCAGHKAGTAQARVHLAVAYERRGDTKAALEQYRSALKLDPKQRDAIEAIKRLGG